MVGLKHHEQLEAELDPHDAKTSALDRYWHYVLNEINEHHVLALDEPVLKSIRTLLPQLKKSTFDVGLKKLEAEVSETYYLAAKQSILDYILLDRDEQLRLKIPHFPQSFQPKLARAPVPWHQEYLDAKMFLEANLYLTNPIMLKILKLCRPFHDKRIVDMRIFTSAMMPLSLDDFQNMVRKQTVQFRSHLLSEYVCCFIL